MPRETHVNVTVDFSKWSKGQYDVRIPAHQPIKQLLGNLIETLNLEIAKVSLFAIKIPDKELLLTDDDRLIDYPVTNGDILQVL
ncbi:EsaB/YukD family protein [Neobacillus vireti]|uniref:EsaB/YukD family protein n=1 Tax=Neobacillus vireti TaxID=220686 RepID=UPI002FFF8F29